MFFIDEGDLADRIAAYFKLTEGQYHVEEVPGKGAKPELIKQKVWDAEPEAPTMSGLAFHLGFNSRKQFEEYETTGAFAPLLKRARLRVEAEYEKKLYLQSSSGAIFALKSMGWTDKESSPANTQSPKTIRVQIIESGPEPAASEKEVEI